MRNCQQTKCELLGTPFCPKCKGCGAEPNVVDEDCVDCWNCERDNGFVRGSIPQEPQREKGIIIIRT